MLPSAPLMHLPISGVPFEWMYMDLVGPLLKFAHGHEYILVIVDYTTRYPEAVPLWKATSQNFVHELMALFSWISIPKGLYTVQGTLFISKLMLNPFRLLQVKHLKTSVDHLQTDRLIKRFNQTL